MKELTKYRENLLKRLEETAEAFRAACLKVSDPHAAFEAGGWTVHKIAVHTRDLDELVYGLRAQRTATEQNPEFPNFDGESYMATNYNPGEPLAQVLDQLVENVQGLVKALRALPTEAWSRVSCHTTLGRGITLQSWVERDLAHIEAHLKTVKSQPPA